MIVVLMLYPVISRLVTLIVFQGHSSVKRFLQKIGMNMPLILIFAHVQGQLWCNPLRLTGLKTPTNEQSMFKGDNWYIPSFEKHLAFSRTSLK